MPDPRFFKFKGALTVSKIASCIDAKIIGNSNLEIQNVATLALAGQNDIAFLTNAKYHQAFVGTKAGACIVGKNYQDTQFTNATMPTMLVVEDPHFAYAQVCELLFEEIKSSYENGAISTKAKIHKSAIIGFNSVIEDDVEIGEGTIIEHNTTIKRGVIIGKNCIISSNCTVSHSIIGDNCIIYPGARIGQDGFGYAASSKGIKKILQLGRVILKNFVEIGANTCIDRGAIEDTIINDNTKLDNLIQVAHNVQIGKYGFLAAQTGIAGSCTIGDQAMIGGQVGFAGHINIGNRAMIAAQSGIIGDLADNAVVMGTPAVPKAEYLRCVAWLRRNAIKK